jgi:hypothetical protein
VKGAGLAGTTEMEFSSMKRQFDNTQVLIRNLIRNGRIDKECSLSIYQKDNV